MFSFSFSSCPCSNIEGAKLSLIHNGSPLLFMCCCGSLSTAPLSATSFPLDICYFVVCFGISSVSNSVNSLYHLFLDVGSHVLNRSLLLSKWMILNVQLDLHTLFCIFTRRENMLHTHAIYRLNSLLLTNTKDDAFLSYPSMVTKLRIFLL